MMSLIVKQKSKRKGGYRVPRKHKEKILHKKRLKTKIYKKRGWKLQYPKYFKEINSYPYIIKYKD